MAKNILVVLRHGESEYTRSCFGGWCDCDLSDIGIEEAKNAGKILKEKGYTFDIAFTSVLKRTIKTLYFVQEELDLHWIPVVKHWRLNEKMYGDLQARNRAETIAKHGAKQVMIWRRGFHILPPPMDPSDERWPGRQAKYKHIDKGLIPKTESQHGLYTRFMPFWNDRIAPAILSGQKVLIAAHGSTMRALTKYLDHISDDEIMKVTIPTAIPLVYEFDADLKPIKRYYLAEEEELKAAVLKVTPPS